MVALGLTVWREFLPELDEGSIWLHAEMPGGISLAKASEMDAELRKAVLEFPEVATIVTHVGRNDDGTDPWTPSHVEAGVVLRPYRSWPAGETKQELIRRMGGAARRIARLRNRLQSADHRQRHRQGVRSAQPAFGQDIRRRFQRAAPYRKDIVGVLEAVPGTADVVVDQRPPLAQIAIKVDRAAAARYGINVADIADLIQTGIGGGAVSQVFIGERRYDTTVRFTPETRTSPEAIGNLTLTSSTGALVPLSQVAHISCKAAKAPSTAT